MWKRGLSRRVEKQLHAAGDTGMLVEERENVGEPVGEGPGDLT